MQTTNSPNKTNSIGVHRRIRLQSPHGNNDKIKMDKIKMDKINALSLNLAEKTLLEKMKRNIQSPRHRKHT